MDTAQVWAVIGVVAAAFFGMMTIVTTLFTRVLRTEIGGLRGELNAEIGGLRGEMNAQIGGLRGEMNARFTAVDARFDAVHTRLDGMDRDIQLLMSREFGAERS